MDIPQFVYPFTCWWTFGLFPVWGFQRLSFCEYLYTIIFMDVCFPFSFSWIKEWWAGPYNSYVLLFMKLSHCFLKCLQHLHSQHLHSQQCMRVLGSLTPYQHLKCSVFLIFSHLNKCVVVSYCGFICISLMTDDVEYLLCVTCCIPYLVNCLFKSFVHF